MLNRFFCRPSRIRTLFWGVMAGVAYGLLCMAIVGFSHCAVSVSFVFMLPMVLGTIPLLSSSREQLSSYVDVLTVFYLSILAGSEG